MSYVQHPLGSRMSCPALEAIEKMVILGRPRLVDETSDDPIVPLFGPPPKDTPYPPPGSDAVWDQFSMIFGETMRKGIASIVYERERNAERRKDAMDTIQSKLYVWFYTSCRADKSTSELLAAHRETHIYAKIYQFALNKAGPLADCEAITQELHGSVYKNAQYRAKEHFRSGKPKPLHLPIGPDDESIDPPDSSPSPTPDEIELRRLRIQTFNDVVVPLIIKLSPAYCRAFVFRKFPTLQDCSEFQEKVCDFFHPWVMTLILEEPKHRASMNDKNLRTAYVLQDLLEMSANLGPATDEFPHSVAASYLIVADSDQEAYDKALRRTINSVTAAYLRALRLLGDCVRNKTKALADEN